MKDDDHSAAREPTNLYVITGAPCSGKTSVIDGLARRGISVVPEVARAYIESQRRLGRTLEQIKADILAFQRHILLEKVQIEQNLPKTRVTFLDRGVPDSIAYYQIEGLDWREPLAHSAMIRYRKVFLFDRLAFEKDGVRSENQTLAARIETLLEKCYRDLGYPILRVPAVPVDQRIEWVVSHIDPS